MEDELRRLSRTTGAAVPLLLDRRHPEQERGLAELLRGGQVVEVCDSLEQQLTELVQARRPGRRLEPAELAAEIALQRGDCPEPLYGTWVFYPWRGRLVRVLPRAAFAELRADRNRLKILAAEQRELAGRRIGIVGLSVGNAVAATLAMEGVGGHLRLADGDTLALSNCNRLRACPADLGLNKAVLAARHVTEIDPYLEVEVWPAGLREAEIERFLLGSGRLDLLIDECDDLALKWRLRERASALGIPVVMHTSDGGLLDVERFDEHRGRPPLHGLLAPHEAAMLGDAGPEQRLGALLSLFPADSISPGMAASITELGVSLSSWPQLASEVVAGAGAVVSAARRILLGERLPSGRYAVDLARAIAPGAELSPDLAAAVPVPVAAAGSAPVAPVPVPVAAAGSVPVSLRAAGRDRDAVRFAVASAVLAPSAGNQQPWRFRWRAPVLECRAAIGSELARSRAACEVATGAALANLELAAQRLGLSCETELLGGGPGDLMARVKLASGRGAAPGELYEQIGRRATDRRLGPWTPLAPGVAQELAAAAEAAGGRLLWADERETRAELGEIVGAIARQRFVRASWHAELFRELRLDEEDDGTGIAAAELAMSREELLFLRLLARPEVAALLGRAGGGGRIAERERVAITGAAGVALLVIGARGGQSYLRGGWLLQQLWLRAARLGLGVQPLGIPLLWETSAADRPRTGPAAHGAPGEDLLDTELAGLRRRWQALFSLPADTTPVLLLRFTGAPPPTRRARRLPLEQVLQLE
jgi:molybdopterin/thiamine biosynthesis adenylyltransferase/nitroreductase